MKEPQPNFEAIKKAFYQAFINCDEAKTHLLMQTVRLLDARCSFDKFKDFKKDFNQWLDRIDIRQSSALINALKEHGKPVPKWASSGQYVIDYNEHGFLDLIRTS